MAKLLESSAHRLVFRKKPDLCNSFPNGQFPAPVAYTIRIQKLLRVEATGESRRRDYAGGA